jgi:hypothetical protein
MVTAGGPAATPTTCVDLFREETLANLLAFAPLAAWPLEPARRPSTTACTPTLNGGGVVR